MNDGFEPLAVTDTPVPVEAVAAPPLAAPAPYVATAVAPPVVPLDPPMVEPLWSQWWFWLALVAPVLLVIGAIALAQRDDTLTQAVAATAEVTTIPSPAAGTLPVPTVASTTGAALPTAPPVAPAVVPVASPTPAPTPTAAAPTPALTPAPTAAPATPAPTAAPAPTTAVPPPPATTFADGAHAVGTSIAAGRYRAPGATTCSWTRSSAQQVIGGWTGRGPAVIDVLGTDAVVTATGCGTFSLVAPATTSTLPPASSVAEGTWIVATDLVAGTWTTSGGPSCTWARVSDFLGTPLSVIAQGTTTTATAVTIDASDAGFVTQGCTWSVA